MKDIKERQKELAAFEASLQGKTLEELNKVEEEIVNEADKNDSEMTKKEFDLPEDNYKVVAEAVRMFLNKQSVQWQYTLGMVGMYDFWDPEKKSEKIPYPQLDAILRTLGNMQFTGYDEWAAVVAINKYFEPLHEAYVDATEMTYDIAARHDAVIKAIDALTPIGDLSEKQS